MEITDKGPSAKMGADILPENTQNTPKFILPICPIGPKVSDVVEKRASLGVRGPWPERSQLGSPSSNH